ncbi:MAG: hypothetical protein K8W52_16970 [Deltaproteobacteria bacterium]|nr:hypothetical protein [Deltaproteobacteria bacterium]
MMKPVRNSLAVALLALAACGGAKPAPSLGNEAPKPAGDSPLAAGSYACEFVFDGGALGPHHCQVEGSTLTKTSGMEPFTGAITGTASEVHVDGQIGCVEGLSSPCHQAFEVTLTPAGGGVWRGKVTAKGNDQWWINNAQFELGPDGSFGGEGYGGDVEGMN